MTATGPVTQGTVRHVHTHKEHAIEMVESIIKAIDLDLCAEQNIEDLGKSGLFDLSRVRPFLKLSFTLFFIHWLIVCLVFRL